MKLLDLVEARTLARGTPLQELIADFKTFTSFNIAKLADYAKPGKEQDIKSVVQRASKSFNEVDLLKTDNEKVHFIHDMISYMLPHMKANLTDERYEMYKPRIQKLLDVYKKAAAALQ